MWGYIHTRIAFRTALSGEGIFGLKVRLILFKLSLAEASIPKVSIHTHLRTLAIPETKK